MEYIVKKRDNNQKGKYSLQIACGSSEFLQSKQITKKAKVEVMKRKSEENIKQTNKSIMLEEEEREMDNVKEEEIEKTEGKGKNIG